MTDNLALIRHGESEWNARDIWTGWTDIGLSIRGFEQAREAANRLKGQTWDYIFESDLLRARQTSDEILKIIDCPKIIRITAPQLRERNYGIYTGKNKSEVKKELGDEIYTQIRRGWDYPISQGESLRQVFDRVVPYYQSEISPKLIDGKRVIISAHGNSLRALIKYLRNISDSEIVDLELKTGEVIEFNVLAELKNST